MSNLFGRFITPSWIRVGAQCTLIKHMSPQNWHDPEDAEATPMVWPEFGKPYTVSRVIELKALIGLRELDVLPEPMKHNMWDWTLFRPLTQAETDALLFESLKTPSLTTKLDLLAERLDEQAKENS